MNSKGRSAPWHIWQCLETFLVDTVGVGEARGWWHLGSGGRDGVDHLAVHRCLPPCHTHTTAQTQQCRSWEPALMVGRDNALTATGQQSRLLQ